MHACARIFDGTLRAGANTGKISAASESISVRRSMENFINDCHCEFPLVSYARVEIADVVHVAHFESRLSSDFDSELCLVAAAPK